MRLFDQLATPGFKLSRQDGSRVAVPDMARTIAGCVRVIADETGSWYWLSPQDVWDYSSHFGPLRVPYTRMWIEWKIPRRIFANGQWHNNLHIRQHGVALIASDPPPSAPEGAAQTIIGNGFAEMRNGVVASVPASMFLHVTAAGEYLRVEYLANQNDPAHQHWIELTNNLMKPAMLAVSLMNCRNVSVEHVAGAPQTRKRRKRGTPSQDHHVIRLPGRPSPANPAAARESAGDPMPFHLVRGHFKTFTDDAPLFGKRVGTYWWGWQTRGKSENGVVTKHYETRKGIGNA